MPVARLIGRALSEVVNCLDVHLFLGHLRSKIQWLFLPTSGIYLDRKLLCSIAMDEANTS
jgi:hypothetical protein